MGIHSPCVYGQPGQGHETNAPLSNADGHVDSSHTGPLEPGDTAGIFLDAMTKVYGLGDACPLEMGLSHLYNYKLSTVAALCHSINTILEYCTLVQYKLT